MGPQAVALCGPMSPTSCSPVPPRTPIVKACQSSAKHEQAGRTCGSRAPSKTKEQQDNRSFFTSLWRTFAMNATSNTQRNKAMVNELYNGIYNPGRADLLKTVFSANLIQHDPTVANVIE